MLTPRWLEPRVERVANTMQAHSALGPLAYRYRQEDDLWAIVLYPRPVALRGRPNDGSIVSPGFSLDLKQLLAIFEEVVAVNWTTQPFAPEDSDNPSIAIEGQFQGQAVFLQILAEAPSEEAPGLSLDVPGADPSELH